MFVRSAIIVAAMIGAPNTHAADESALPNIIFILADDMGYGDPQCYNPASMTPTPNIDRLAREGMRFTDAHTPSAVCTPTRYGVLTGRYCWRTWLTAGVLDGFGPPLIERDRLTLPQMLRQRGYATTCIGKWHLGMQWTHKDGRPVDRRDMSGGFRSGADVDFTKPVTGGPIDCGFDEFFGISASLDMSPYCFMRQDRTVGLPTIATEQVRENFISLSAGVTVDGFEPKHVLPALAAEAEAFIGRQTSGAGRRPFFIYMPLNSPHLPVVPNEPFAGSSGAGTYGDFVVETDAAVGRVLDALDRAGVSRDTLVIFTSDNGGLWHWWEAREADDVAHYRMTPRARYVRDFGHQSNAHLRGTKADIWEGGHRVPFVARWPAKIKAGSVSDELIELTDTMATCAAIVGAALPNDAAEDSYNMLPVLLDERRDGPIREAAVHHSLRGMFAIRQGPWKLVLGRGSGGFSTPRTLNPKPGEPEGQLYNLASDPSETSNVWLQHPQIVERLTALLERYRESGRSTPHH